MSVSVRMMRCDLHVHSFHSGPATVPIMGRFARECYSSPAEVYEAARRKEMDFVTLTDHDTIAGALELAGRSDTFVSEEVTCLLPQGRQLHLGVFDITEAQHETIARRRSDAEALFAYLAEERIPTCANHLFSALTGPRETADIHLALQNAGLVEARNGMMSEGCNLRAARAGRRTGRAPCGGSDAHTLASVARAYTSVPAHTREEFLAGLRQGLTIPTGESGSYARLTADVAHIVSGAYRDQARRSLASDSISGGLAFALVLLPLIPLLPLVTAAIYLHEQLFMRRHYRLFRSSHRRIGRGGARRLPLAPPAAAGLMS